MGVAGVVVAATRADSPRLRVAAAVAPRDTVIITAETRPAATGDCLDPATGAVGADPVAEVTRSAACVGCGGVGLDWGIDPLGAVRFLTVVTAGVEPEEKLKLVRYYGFEVEQHVETVPGIAALVKGAVELLRGTLNRSGAVTTVCFPLGSCSATCFIWNDPG